MLISMSVLSYKADKADLLYKTLNMYSSHVSTSHINYIAKAELDKNDPLNSH